MFLKADKELAQSRQINKALEDLTKTKRRSRKSTKKQDWRRGQLKTKSKTNKKTSLEKGEGGEGGS
jgi:hypothetical protein